MDDETNVDRSAPPNRPLDWLFVILCAIIGAGVIACIIILANTSAH